MDDALRLTAEVRLLPKHPCSAVWVSKGDCLTQLVLVLENKYELLIRDNMRQEIPIRLFYFQKKHCHKLRFNLCWNVQHPLPVNHLPNGKQMAECITLFEFKK